jgi:hypothetical protein
MHGGMIWLEPWRCDGSGGWANGWTPSDRALHQLRVTRLRLWSRLDDETKCERRAPVLVSICPKLDPTVRGVG